MESNRSIRDKTRLIAGFIFAAILLAWLYLMALNGRYMYANMEGDDLIIDKWTKTIYVNRGESKLTKIKSLQKTRYTLPSFEEARKNSK
ncbi:MAG: hypothetical protein Q7J06_11700 [Bacteroidales bacterium]|nr:hypothetical protein [Bacteroidales bacterium]